MIAWDGVLAVQGLFGGLAGEHADDEHAQEQEPAGPVRQGDEDQGGGGDGRGRAPGAGRPGRSQPTGPRVAAWVRKRLQAEGWVSSMAYGILPMRPKDQSGPNGA